MNTIPEVPYRDMDYFFRKKHWFGVQKRPDHKVTAAFPNRMELDQAITDLQRAGIRNDEMYTSLVRGGCSLTAPERLFSLAPFFVPIGLVAGAVIGAIMGMLTYFGYLKFFGIAPFHNSFWQSMQASSIVGAFTLGIISLIFGLRLPEYQPWKFETDLPEGTHLLMVRAVEGEQAAMIQRVLQRRVEDTSFPEVTEQLAA